MGECKREIEGEREMMEEREEERDRCTGQKREPARERARWEEITSVKAREWK